MEKHTKNANRIWRIFLLFILLLMCLGSLYSQLEVTKFEVNQAENQVEFIPWCGAEPCDRVALSKYHFTWQIGDCDFRFASKPVVIFPEAGAHNVKMKVSNIYDVDDEDEAEVMDPGGVIVGEYDSIIRIFGISFTPPELDNPPELDLDLAANDDCKAGFNMRYILFFDYYGPEDGSGKTSAELTFRPDPRLTVAADPVFDSNVFANINYLSSSGEFLIETQKIVPGTHCEILFEFTVDPDLTPEDSIVSILVGNTLDTLRSSDSVRTVTAVVSSWDPNMKTVFPQDLVNPGEKLIYTVFFENYGNGNAYYVRVEDRLSDFLNLSTFTPMASSHPYSNWGLNGNEMKCEFTDIMLKPSDENPERAKGWLRFSIETKPGLPPETKIVNRARIFFDHDTEGILTNRTKNFIRCRGGGEEGYSTAKIPTPFNWQLFLLVVLLILCLLFLVLWLRSRQAAATA